MDKHKASNAFLGGGLSSLNPLWILAESRWLIFPSLQAEVFLPVIVLISPKEQGPAGRRAGPAPDKAHSRAPPGRGQGRRGAPAARPPAAVTRQRGTAHPRRPPANPARLLPGRTSPRRHQSERDPTAGAWAPQAHPHRPSGPISGPGMRSPQARSRAGPSRA